MQSLEDALGVPALLKLKDWLNTRFPDGSEHIRGQGAIYQEVEREIAEPAQTGKYLVERYNDRNGREWFRVIEAATGDVAVREFKSARNVRQRCGVRLDFFLSESEACRAAWESFGG